MNGPAHLQAKDLVFQVRLLLKRTLEITDYMKLSWRRHTGEEHGGIVMWKQPRVWDLQCEFSPVSDESQWLVDQLTIMSTLHDACQLLRVN
jgi:hypothetical protein